MVGALRLFALLPWRAVQWVGTAIGWLMWKLPNRSREVARINLSKCFPELSEPELEKLVGRSLMDIGKTLTEGGYDSESIGLLAFRGDGGRRFAAEVDRMMRKPDGTRRWYLRAIDELALAGADVRTVSIHGEDWQEVDFPADVVKAKALTARWASRS